MPDVSRIILHVGAAKCGSTSIQTALCRKPTFTAHDGRRFEYVAIDRSGRLLRDAALARRAEVSLMGSTASVNVASVEDVESLLVPALPALQAMIDDGVTPILSCEGWARAAEAFAETRLPERLGGGARAIMFVRPPVDWLNSAWWQWGTWTRLSLDVYIKRNLPRLRWPLLADAWKAVPGVSGVDVALATSDVTVRFFNMLDVTPPPPVTTNAGMPSALLMFMQRNRSYRPDPHSPKTEFIVARHLPPQRFPTPWALSQAQVENVFTRLVKMPPNLRKLLTPEDRAAMDSDPRWHTPTAYADRQVDDLTQFETPEALADPDRPAARRPGPRPDGVPGRRGRADRPRRARIGTGSGRRDDRAGHRRDGADAQGKDAPARAGRPKPVIPG